MKAFPGNCTFNKVKNTISCKLVIFRRNKKNIPLVKNASKMFNIAEENVTAGIILSSTMISIAFVAKSSKS